MLNIKLLSPYFFLSIAIISEVIATTALRATESFSRIWPTLTVIIGYGVSFYMLTYTLKTIPIGVAYAVWSGAGMVLVTMLGYVVYKQKMDMYAIFGIFLIILGVAVINLFSKSQHL